MITVDSRSVGLRYHRSSHRPTSRYFQYRYFLCFNNFNAKQVNSLNHVYCDEQSMGQRTSQSGYVKVGSRLTNPSQVPSGNNGMSAKKRNEVVRDDWEDDDEEEDDNPVAVEERNKQIWNEAYVRFSLPRFRTDTYGQ
jgi:hypothetical protein